ncbi:hypothetical protein, partial [Segatella hominis]|uniref:hypothetical protein n=1 Tax=Segatella hominis TaxID=2518605 RepID=UPI003AB0B616
TPSNLFEEEIRKSQINKYSRFPKCLVKTEEKYTDEPNTSRPSLGSQMKDFGTKTHFFSKKK